MDESAGPSVREGSTAWRIARADRARVMIDAATYFPAIRDAMAQAKHRILLIGWEFDTRILLNDGWGGDHPGPDRLAEFLLWLANKEPELRIYILNWNIGAFKLLLRGRTAFTLLRWARHPRIFFRLDSAHPPGCSHHQKIAVVDDCLAACGGIDMTRERWDTSEHKEGDPRRQHRRGRGYKPWHDATMLVDGPAAQALAELGLERWRVATGEELPPPQPCGALWPTGIDVHFENADVAISRTRAAFRDREEVREIEALYLELIARAKRFIYAENQYFASRRVAEAIAARAAEPDGPEVMIVGPRRADGWLEQEAMDAARARLIRAIGRRDLRGRFGYYTPVNEAGTPIYVHAKVLIVDDQVLRIGSSNMNNRSLGLDSECDVTIDTALPANSGMGAAIAALRTRLMAEHLNAAEADVARTFAETGSLHATAARLTRPGRALKPLPLDDFNAVEKLIADKELLDPERADGFFEPIARRGLFRRWRERARWRAARPTRVGQPA
ncbi:MAG: Phospholipase D/Transphosphatidylase [uncultured Sphingomonadaceae bacterium]|uniref:Phospholipase D n=1 Tax=uncultured Sphingomonadaceae bacterium TaxID=169976 RepID=A0A6J4S729_9SPHN|nr:MAG: Phospholipase D/Transphosphatidylase [uncultured Sphingomonadaceae bacterium]